MGGKGIDIRAKSIRVTFTYQGKQERRTIVLNGEPLHPSPANIKYAERLAAEIREKVRLGSFVMSEYFPVDGDTLESLSLEKHLEAWLSAQRIEHSTQAGYTSAAKFWTTSLPGKTVKGLEPMRPGALGASRGNPQSEAPSITPLRSRFLSQLYP